MNEATDKGPQKEKGSNPPSPSALVDGWQGKQKNGHAFISGG